MVDIKKNDSKFCSDSMIESAQNLHRVCEELDNRFFEKHSKSKTDTHLLSGTIQTVPILKSLAIEIALKALLNLKQEKNCVCFTHDLVDLFDELKSSTQEKLEARMRKLSPNSIWADHLSSKELGPNEQDMLNARMDPLHNVLETHRDAHKHWRYLYETKGCSFETGELDLVLTVIFDAYSEMRNTST